MIATLTGVVAEKLTHVVVLDVRGVGYGLFVTNEDHGQLTTGQPTKLYVYEHIREQLYDLYGFSKFDNKRLFEQLLEVNGVGPRMALNVLSIGNAGIVRQAIASGDVTFIQGAQGVGKRVAERIVVELKDKVGLVPTDLQSAGLLQSEAAVSQDEAVAALMTLGYSIQDASAALAHIDSKLSTEDRIKLALKGDN
ncbi:MAG TPA: Holliday junction branch migration protein RuvA [Candidatus Saccharimonadales bacterium]|nr:Holliday junction branch migration protein RuvA [Candidatus Saccharimonadales bacterium]